MFVVKELRKTTVKLLNVVELVDIIVVFYYFIKSDSESLLVISETDSVNLKRSS